MPNLGRIQQSAGGGIAVDVCKQLSKTVRVVVAFVCAAMARFERPDRALFLTAVAYRVH